MGRGVAACASRSELALLDRGIGLARRTSVERAHGLGEPLPLGRRRLELRRASDRAASLRAASWASNSLAARRAACAASIWARSRASRFSASANSRALDRGRDLDQALLRGIPLGHELELQRPPPDPPRSTCSVSTSPSRVMTVRSPIFVQRRPRGARGVEVVDDDDAGEQPAHAVGRGDEVGGGARPRPGSPSSGAAAAASATTISTRPASPRPHGRERGERGVAVVGEHRVGERAERRGDRRLVPGAHLHVLGDQSADAARADDRARAVLLVDGAARARRCGRRARRARARRRAARRAASRPRPASACTARSAASTAPSSAAVLGRAALGALEREQLGAGGLPALLGLLERGALSARARPAWRRGGTRPRRPRPRAGRCSRSCRETSALCSLISSSRESRLRLARSPSRPRRGRAPPRPRRPRAPSRSASSRGLLDHALARSSSSCPGSSACWPSSARRWLARVNSAAQAVLHLLEAEGDAPGVVDGVADMRLLERRLRAAWPGRAAPAARGARSCARSRCG